MQHGAVDAAGAARELDKVTIRFSGDSGDGMQLTGTLFSDESALFGNDLMTFPDYPSEIRAPAGTVAGVSSFQVQFGSLDVMTPGDFADVLVAMNPAALKANIGRTQRGGIVILDKDAWTESDLKTAEYVTDPLEDGSLEDYRPIAAPITTMTREALKDLDLDAKGRERCKNMFALGMMLWLYSRPTTNTENYIREKFAKKPVYVEANGRALKAGYDFAQTIEEFVSPYRVGPSRIEPGRYRQVSGNQAVALGMIAAAERCGRKLVLGSYPITPASDILHELVKHKEFDVRTVQAEDEIAGVCVAIGAAFAGALALTTTSGPGLDLKSEALGLAVMSELPLVVVNVQRGGPSTGLPTKTEQSDLLLALYGRHGESPMPVIAASTPSDCFHYAFESARIALEHMTPVILLTDGYLANGSEPWKVPDAAGLPRIKTHLVTNEASGFKPYRRDDYTLARDWAVPGTPGFEHRIGGLEKQEVTGSVSYDPVNHERMVKLRAEKIARIAADIPLQEVFGEQVGELLVIGWGGTFGALRSAVKELIDEGESVSHAHVRYINPLPRNFGNVVTSFRRVIVCELNTGQFHRYLLSLYPLQDVRKYNKVQGLPFSVDELKQAFREVLKGES